MTDVKVTSVELTVAEARILLDAAMRVPVALADPRHGVLLGVVMKLRQAAAPKPPGDKPEAGGAGEGGYGYGDLCETGDGESGVSEDGRRGRGRPDAVRRETVQDDSGAGNGGGPDLG